MSRRMAREAVRLVLAREMAGLYYRWDLGYNGVIQWDEEWKP